MEQKKTFLQRHNQIIKDLALAGEHIADCDHRYNSLPFNKIVAAYDKAIHDLYYLCYEIKPSKGEYPKLKDFVDIHGHPLSYKGLKYKDARNRRHTR